jgi:hypothetical protein
MVVPPDGYPTSEEVLHCVCRAVNTPFHTPANVGNRDLQEDLRGRYGKVSHGSERKKPVWSLD